MCAKLAGRQMPNGGLVEWLACKLNVIERDRGSMHVHIVFVYYVHVCTFLRIYLYSLKFSLEIFFAKILKKEFLHFAAEVNHGPINGSV